MGSAAMVGDYVHNDLDAFPVRLVDELTIQFIGTEPGVDMIVIGACVTVI